MGMIANENRHIQYEVLKPSQQIYVDWLAGGQTLIDQDGKLEQLTSIALSERVGVTRQALWKYRKLPGFWDMVRERRTELYGQDRMSLIYRAMMGKALKGDTSAAKLMMQQARVLEAERTALEVSGTIAVAVVNYGTGGGVSTPIIESSTALEKSVSVGEKAQKFQVPVPRSITSHTQPDESYSASGEADTAKAVKPPKVREPNPPRQQPLEGRAEVVLEPGKAPIRLKRV